MNKGQITQTLQSIKSYSSKLRQRYIGYGFSEPEINQQLINLLSNDGLCSSSKITDKKQVRAQQDTNERGYAQKIQRILMDQVRKRKQQFGSYLIEILGILELQLAYLEDYQKLTNSWENIKGRLPIQTEHQLAEEKVQTASNGHSDSFKAIEQGEKKSNISSTEVESQEETELEIRMQRLLATSKLYKAMLQNQLARTSLGGFGLMSSFGAGQPRQFFV